MKHKDQCDVVINDTNISFQIFDGFGLANCLVFCWVLFCYFGTKFYFDYDGFVLSTVIRQWWIALLYIFTGVFVQELSRHRAIVTVIAIIINNSPQQQQSAATATRCETKRNDRTTIKIDVYFVISFFFFGFRIILPFYLRFTQRFDNKLTFDGWMFMLKPSRPIEGLLIFLLYFYFLFLLCLLSFSRLFFFRSVMSCVVLFPRILFHVMIIEKETNKPKHRAKTKYLSFSHFHNYKT